MFSRWPVQLYLVMLAVLLIGCEAPVPVPAQTAAPLAAATAPAAPGVSSPPAGRVPLVVFGAGSLIVPFDALEAAFEAQHPQIDVRAEYHGSIQVIRHATELQEPIDIVATADASLIPMLMTGAIDPETGRAYAEWYIRFASNRLTLAYHRGSKYAAELTADNWPEILARSDVKVGIADPRFDASGYRALMAVVLAQERAHRYTYFADLFQDQFARPVTLFLEETSHFIAFLLGPEGRAVMEANNHPLFETPLAGGYERLPAELQALCRPLEPPLGLRCVVQSGKWSTAALPGGAARRPRFGIHCATWRC